MGLWLRIAGRERGCDVEYERKRREEKARVYDYSGARLKDRYIFVIDYS